MERKLLVRKVTNDTLFSASRDTFILCIFGLDLGKAIVIFEINTLEFFKKFCAKIIWVFLAGIGKWYCHIGNQSPWICLTANFGPKTKTLKFGIKNCFIWIIFAWNYRHILNQRPQIFLIAKFRGKWTSLNVGQKLPHLDIFGLIYF